MTTPITLRPPARAYSIVSAVWLIVPRPGRATIRTGSCCKAAARSRMVARAHGSGRPARPRPQQPGTGDGGTTPRTPAARRQLPTRRPASSAATLGASGDGSMTGQTSTIASSTPATVTRNCASGANGCPSRMAVPVWNGFITPASIPRRRSAPASAAATTVLPTPCVRPGHEDAPPQVHGFSCPSALAPHYWGGPGGPLRAGEPVPHARTPSAPRQCPRPCARQ